MPPGLKGLNEQEFYFYRPRKRNGKSFSRFCLCVCVCFCVSARSMAAGGIPLEGRGWGGGLFFPVFHLCRPTFNERTGTAVCLGYLQNSHE